MRWAKVLKGERKGNLVPVLDVNPSINLLTGDALRNPYAMGYGQRIPTRYKVRAFNQRWHRVYVCQLSNAGTAYIMHKGEAYRVDW